MTRQSSDEFDQDGTILNGFDYNLQVWVKDGICLDVGYGRAYVGQRVKEIIGHEVRCLICGLPVKHCKGENP